MRRRRRSVRLSSSEAAALRRLFFRGLGALPIGVLALAVIQKDQTRLARAGKKRS